jgi:hypothetical protein
MKQSSAAEHLHHLGKKAKIRQTTKIAQLFETIVKIPPSPQFVNKFSDQVRQFTGWYLRMTLDEGAFE